MSQIVEMVSNFQQKKFGLNVRRDGPQPSVFVRSFSAITSSMGVNADRQHAVFAPLSGPKPTLLMLGAKETVRKKC